MLTRRKTHTKTVEQIAEEARKMFLANAPKLTRKTKGAARKQHVLPSPQQQRQTRLHRAPGPDVDFDASDPDRVGSEQARAEPDLVCKLQGGPRRFWKGRRRQ